MWRALRIGSARRPQGERQAAPGALRDRLAVLLGLLTVVGLGAAFILTKDTHFLMPGPLASGHGAIENCNACHTKSGSGKLSWVHGLVAGDRLADSKACLTCHNMPDTAFNAHGASPKVLQQSTSRLTKTAKETPVPQSARAQSIAFPTDGIIARGLYCATCHQEHQGVNFDLNTISNEQCRSCHVVKFDSFDGHHPEFENYPFKRRTPIIYDHAAHFGKHFPEVAKTDPARRIPATCSTCHNASKDRRVMAVAPFEQTCTGCHLDQIIGKERVSGPKGIAFLTLPGLDLQTLKKKKASIGEWPEASEAGLTPFMKVMISRNARGRALVKTVEHLNLQDLSKANDTQIKAVTSLAWEIKGLFYALIKGKASDVLGDLDIGGGAKLSAGLVADLTASIPRDVVTSAQQQWLPNLGTEMTRRPGASEREQTGWSTTITDSDSVTSASSRGQSGSDARQATSTPESGSEAPQPKGAVGNTGALPTDGSGSALAESGSDGSDSAEARPGSDRPAATPGQNPKAPARAAAGNPNPNSQACIMRVFGQCVLSKAPENGAGASKPDGAAGRSDTANPSPDSGKEQSSADNLPLPSRAGLNELAQATQLEGAARKTDPSTAKRGKATLAAKQQPQSKSGDQTDDLLHLTDEELRVLKTGKGAEAAAQFSAPAGKGEPVNARPDRDASADAASRASISAPEPQTRPAPEISIESSVDPESWAEYGGWYRQDYAISYRPAGHKDKFIYSWLFLTGPKAPKGETSPAAAVFNYLTSKDAQGSCTKCHSIDDIQRKGRVVNFSPPTVESKRGRFTNFIHEPHFGILETRGCLTCHSLEKDPPYLKSYEQGNPQSFVSNFGAVKKELCQTCHTSSMARQDCLLCHKYHVNGVITPIMDTRLPVQ